MRHHFRHPQAMFNMGSLFYSHCVFEDVFCMSLTYYDRGQDGVRALNISAALVVLIFTYDLNQIFSHSREFLCELNWTSNFCI
jgi:hypothetical protein